MRGFTLVELVVVAAIISMVSAVLIVGQSTFSRTILLTNTTTDVALSLRNAQVFGISNRASGAISNANYGISFTTGSSFIFFADTHPGAAGTKPTDKPGNGYYCASAVGVCTGVDALVQTFTMNNGMTVTNFCALAGSEKFCNTGGTTPNMLRLAVVFGRPNTSATFVLIDSGQNVKKTNSVGAVFTSACIEVSSQQATKRVIKVTQFGEIVVTGSTTTCP